jgi:hypothetical protein
MEIKTSDYTMWYEASATTIYCKGSFRLGGVEEYAPIVQLLNDAAATQPPALTLNLSELEFLNSSGINILSKFVISMRQKGNIQIIVQGSKKIPWQSKSLQNLQRLMPSLKLELN